MSARITKDAWRLIKLIALDVDGVLTDGSVWWGSGGEEFKQFSFSDIMGISMAHQHGLVSALISGETSPLIHRYAAKMAIKEVFAGCRDKASALEDIAKRNGLKLSEVCFMGDDVNDSGAMQSSGLSAAPSDAQPAILRIASFVSSSRGGHGAVRELIDKLLIAKEPIPEQKVTNSL